MLHQSDFAQTVDSAVTDANDLLRRALLSQGDDRLLVRRIDFGFRRARLFAARPPVFLHRMAELGLTPLPASKTTGAEGDLILWITASPHAIDFDLFDTMVSETAAECGWRNEGWSSFVREAI